MPNCPTCGAVVPSIFEHVDGCPTYKIMRYRFNGETKCIKRGLTLEEAREHCNDPSTEGDGWFDGYTEE